jgi:hypothetical protein
MKPQLSCEGCLEERDDRVTASIVEALKYNRDLADQMRWDAMTLEKEAREIEKAVEHQAWWKLEHLLAKEDIESLCNISPSDLLSQEDA